MKKTAENILFGFIGWFTSSGAMAFFVDSLKALLLGAFGALGSLLVKWIFDYLKTKRNGGN